MKTTKNKKRNYAIPSEPMTQEEFAVLVKEAEKGPFFPIEELHKSIAKWKSQNEK